MIYRHAREEHINESEYLVFKYIIH